jgi:hypothetical protein
LTEPKKEMTQEIIRFHQVVESGSLEELQQELEKGVDLNAPGQNGESALMIAIAAKDPEKMKLLLEQGADPELTDDYNATALRHAVQADFVDGVRHLLTLGVDRGYHPKYPLKVINYDLSWFDSEHVKMPDEFKGVMTDEEWKESLEETNKSVIELGQNPTIEPIIGDVYSTEVLNLFLKAGDDLSQASPEMQRLLLKLDDEATFQASAEDYRKNKTPRFGKTNPERMDNPFWSDMIRIGCNAYQARVHFKDDSAFNKPGAVWCFDRFGSTLTPIPDGRYVQIGGEHEDYYDPDFYIYNDVVIHDGQGNFELYGYPKKVFPPTDFHTATLVKEEIYLIGCLGYPEQRVNNQTPVYHLKTETWEIEAVKTSGDLPAWVYRHRASYVPQRNVIQITGGERQSWDKPGEPELVTNEDTYELDLSTFIWRKLD